MAKNINPGLLMMAVILGGCAIYAMLWTISEYTSLSGSRTMVLFIPLSLLWLVTCLGFYIWKR
jgi:hypothetical protein